MFGSKKLDFLAVGDITTDAFIRLKDASVHCNIDNEKCELCVRFADKIPYEFVEVLRAVGNSPNAAVSAARLGLKSGLVTNMGDDQNGKECLDVLKAEKISTKFVTQHKGKETNYHYVLWYEADRTILVKHQAYTYTLPDIGSPKWLYISSMGEHTLDYHTAIINHVNKHPEIKVAFQPGTFQINLGVEKLAALYKRVEVFICNKEEAQKILATDSTDIKNLLEKVHELGPKIVLITDGPKGAYVLENGTTLFMPPYPDPKPPYERTGAGDAYASTFVCALALGKNPAEALQLAGINSMSVVQQIGAQRGLLTKKAIEEWLKKAPPDYQPKAL
ncbi:MAG: carbohydrate kinase family protein [Patescibacteria group bacterium]